MEKLDRFLEWYQLPEDARKTERELSNYFVSEATTGPAFDGWHIILFENEGSETFVWRQTGSPMVDEFVLPQGTVSTVIEEFLRWLGTG